ncbi:MAG: amidohydrolase family protein [Oscillospiraceae bacterium]|nr:amidohydrolase family protein [Oscillospiraceae bacterium]
MEFIDFHTHVYPNAIAPKAADSIRVFYGFGEKAMDGTVKTLLERGDIAGTHRFVILPVAMRPENTRHINDFILQTVAEEPRFFGFGTIHAAMENIMDEVDYIMQKGLRGIKMHPDSQVFAIDDERLLSVYEHIQDRLPVILHMGDHRFDYSHPKRLRRVLDMFPDLQVIAAHFGAYEIYEEAYDQLKDTECFFDVSSSLMFMGEGVAESYVNRYGAERFVYGSDYPMWDPAEEMQRFLKLKLTDRQFEQIAHKTAEAILKLC